MYILRSACHHSAGRHSAGRRLAALGASAILVLAACGDDEEDDATPSATAEDTAAAATDAPSTTASDRGGYGAVDTEAPASGAAAGVLLADTSLGQVVTGDDGMTVYLFLPDNSGAPTCVADCATTWPPLLVEDGATPTAGDGLDAALLGTVANPEGGTQVTYNSWPLYHYAPDSAPGDTNGQGIGDVWYAVGADGEPVE